MDDKNLPIMNGMILVTVYLNALIDCEFITWLINKNKTNFRSINDSFLFANSKTIDFRVSHFISLTAYNIVRIIINKVS